MTYAKEQLRKAGKALQKFDQAYSDKIVEMYAGPKDKERGYMEHPVFGTLAGMGAAYGGGTPMSDRGGLETAPGAAYTSAAAKYAAPVVGVTMAGMAVLDLTARFGGAADQPEPNTLSM